ncbi:hypothetical protein GCM10010403_22630 [Glycomyces rutgersensis]|uniref:Uncharacterized protein n=1 Tax=Glycomyces rutgersensis TaxID=58115 RepID=A0ABN3FHX1_9ACTN
MEDEFTSPDAYRAVGAEVQLPPKVVRTFARQTQSRAEYEAETIALEIVGLFRNHGIHVTDELCVAAGDLAFAAALTQLNVNALSPGGSDLPSPPRRWGLRSHVHQTTPEDVPCGRHR